MMGDRKLSSEQVREIRRRYAGGNTCKVLAMEYGVSLATISNCVAGVKREPADRNERVSFGGDPLPSELNAANAGNSAAEKQRGSDKPGGGDKTATTVEHGGGVPADTPGDTDNKTVSGADEKQGVNGAEKTAGADEKPGGNLRDKAEEKESFVFTKKLRMLFDESGKTYGEMGAFFKEKTGKGITNEAIRNWCKGSYFPGVINIPVIAEFFGVSTDFLLTSAEDRGRKQCVCGDEISNAMSGEDERPDGLDVCDLATGFFMFLEKNISGDISINILRRDGVVEIKISEKDEELVLKRRVGGSGGGDA